MTPVGDPERVTQNRVIDFFSGELGYRYLDDWSEREDNSNVEDDILAAWLGRRGHTDTQVARTLDLLRREARNPNRNLYDNNKAVYSLLRYGVQVKEAVGENTVTVPLIDWAKASSSTSITSAGTPSCQATSRPTRPNGSPSTSQWPRCFAAMPIWRTNSSPPGTPAPNRRA